MMKKTVCSFVITAMVFLTSIVSAFAATTTEPAPTGPVYTGLIVDAQGLGLVATFSPLIYDESRRIIYGDKAINSDFAISEGVVEYADKGQMADAAAAAQTRAGKTPLTVKALRLAGNDVHVVISNADAEKILSAQSANDFLARCAVVFIK